MDLPFFIDFSCLFSHRFSIYRWIFHFYIIDFSFIDVFSLKVSCCFLFPVPPTTGPLGPFELPPSRMSLNMAAIGAGALLGLGVFKRGFP